MRGDYGRHGAYPRVVLHLQRRVRPFARLVERTHFLPFRFFCVRYRIRTIPQAIAYRRFFVMGNYYFTDLRVRFYRFYLFSAPNSAFSRPDKQIIRNPLIARNSSDFNGYIKPPDFLRSRAVFHACYHINIDKLRYVYCPYRLTATRSLLFRRKSRKAYPLFQT